MGNPLVGGFNLTDLPGQFAGSATMPVTALAPGDTLEQPRGTTRLYSATFVDPETQLPLVGIFDGTEALRCFVWEGMGGPILDSPAVAWSSTSPPIVVFSILPADLAALDLQPYPIRVEVDRGGQWQDGWDGWITPLPEPATATSTPVYCSYLDMTGKGGSAIRQILTPDEGAGFLRSRAEARRYIDQVILAKYRPVGGRYFGFSTGLIGYATSLDTPNPIIKGYLDDDLLIVTDQVVEIAARKALALLFDRQEDPKWRMLAAVEHLRADWGLASLVAQIDINGDGFSDISINCGVSSARNI